jgi:DNA-binding SARP family transcriptional activator/tetratricopeptide (TPR) repeat protein
MIGRGECAQLQVRLFGGAGVHGVYGPAKLSPHQLALVGVVYGHASKGLSRSRATQLIWGTEASSAARHRLRQLLVEVRERVGRRIVDTHADMLRPCVDVASDLATFEQCLSNGPLLDCALLVRSGFACVPAGSVADDYDDWREAAELAQLRRLRAHALARWDVAHADCDWPGAKDAAESLYALDPRDSEAVCRMIEALAKQGQPEASERVFLEYRSGLPKGIRPTADLIEAIDRVRRLRNESPSVFGSADGEVPLIGRRDALAQARPVFDQVRAERFGFLLIGGESGIGKTRVLRELQREAVMRDFRCLHAQAVELECRIPLNPLLDALESVDLRPHLEGLGQPWSAVIAGVLPAGALDHPVAAPPPIQDSALPRRLFDALSLLFESLARERPTLIFLDDIQWADATTVAALQFMQRRWHRGHFGVIATIRPELVRSEDDLAKYLSSRSDGLGINRVDLGELSTDAALELVEQIGEGELGRELAHRICALAGLHPLYLTELARDYLAGRLKLPELPVHEVTIPVSLKQILDSRLTYLSDAARKVAGMLAVAARPIRLADAGRLVALSLDQAADAVDELRGARLIEYERDRVRIAHELFRAAIYRHLSEPRRAINHRAVAELIESEAAVDSAGELATHYSRAGELSCAAKYGWTAAERAMEAGAVAEAAHFYQLVTENDREPVRRAEATAAQARALHLTRDINRANPLLELAARRLYAVGKPTEALRLEIKRVEGLAEVGAASLPDLLERLATIKSQARAREDWEGVALALDVELHLLVHDGNVLGARDLFRQLREVLPRADRRARAVAYAGLAIGLFFGDAREALDAGLGSVRMSEGGPPVHRLTSLNRLIVVLYHRGVLGHDTSRVFIDEALDLAERSGDRLQRYSLESNLAAQHMDAGDLERADLMLAKAHRLFGSAGMTAPRVNHACNVGELALAKGEFLRAESAFRQVSELLGPATPRYTSDFVNAGLGLCALERGALSDARRHVDSLNDVPITWYFDPSTIVTFRARMLTLRGRHEEVADLLAATADDLNDRLCLAWLKVRSLQARIMKKLAPIDAKDLAMAGLEKAQELRLHHRVSEFSQLADSIARTRQW